MALTFFQDDDVRRLVDMPTAIGVLEAAFCELAEGSAHNVPRRRARIPGIVLHQMSAGIESLGVVGCKVYTTTREGARFHVALFDASTGALNALFDADWLGRLRTGAATGLAVHRMADPAADEVAVIGCGRQAETQLAAVAAVRLLQRVRVYCRDEERRTRFAHRMSRQLQVDVRAVESVRAAVEHCPIVVTVTTSRTPVVPADAVAPRTLICAAGSNWPNKSELDVGLVARCSPIVCDQVEACRLEAGELIQAERAGAFDWGRAIELSDLVAGKVDLACGDGDRPESPRLFKSVGLALEDVALAAEVVRRSRNSF